MAFDLNPVKLGGTKKLANAFTGAEFKFGAKASAMGFGVGKGAFKAFKSSMTPGVQNVQQGITQAPAMSRDFRSNPTLGGNDALSQALGEMGAL